MKTCIYSIHKAKNAFDTMFQITCVNVWKNIIVCLVCVCVCVCVFFFFKLTSEPLSWNWKKKLYVLSNQVGSMFFKIFTKVSLSNIVWNLKIGKKSFPYKMFKHSKISNVTQIFLKKHPYQMCFFFRTTIFSI